MPETKRRTRSAVRNPGARRVARPGRFQLAAQRQASIRATFLTSSRLDVATLRRSEDSFVDELILGVLARGHPLMRAHFPRCYVDVNREPYELDPRMFDGRLPSFANTRSMRVAGGLGTVARVVGDAQEIYGQRIPVDDAIRRIESLYKPYHRALRRLFTRVHRDFGAAVLIDCHSMPSTAGAKDERPRADVVLGDRYGTSCVPAVAETVEDDVARPGLRGQPQQALCRRLHHRALRQSGRGPARHPARDQPRALHGRADASSARRPLRRSPPIWRRWRTVWPISRSRSCGRSGRRPNRPADDKEKRAAVARGPSLGRKRPRRAAVAQALPHRKKIHRTAQNARADFDRA